MSYRCGICQEAVDQCTLMCRHVVKRPDGQIEREIAICRECDMGFKSGYNLQQMVSIRGPKVGVSPLVAKVIAPTMAKPKKAASTPAPAAKVVVFDKRRKK